MLSPREAQRMCIGGNQGHHNASLLNLAIEKEKKNTKQHRIVSDIPGSIFFFSGTAI